MVFQICLQRCCGKSRSSRMLKAFTCVLWFHVVPKHFGTSQLRYLWDLAAAWIWQKKPVEAPLSHCQGNGISAFSIHEYFSEWLYTLDEQSPLSHQSTGWTRFLVDTPPHLCHWRRMLQLCEHGTMVDRHGPLESLGTGHGGHGGAGHFFFTWWETRRHNKVATDLLNLIEFDFFKIEMHRSS